MLTTAISAEEPDDSRPDPYAEAGTHITGQNSIVPHRIVLLIYRIITATLIPATLARWSFEKRSDLPGGRNRCLSDVAIIVVMLVLALEYSPLQFRRAAVVLHRRLEPASMRLLNVPEGATEAQCYDWVQNGFSRMISLMDPKWAKYDKRMTRAESDALQAERDAKPEYCAEQQTKLDWFCNTLLAATVLARPSILDGWDGNITIDATAFRVFTKRGGNRVWASIEPDASHYRRDAKHQEVTEDKKARVSFYGYEMHVVVPATNDGYFALDRYCKPIIGISCCKPSEKPAHFGLSAIKSAWATFGDTMKGALVVADRGYFANAKPEHLQIPLRQLGMGFITDYKIDQLGVQDGYAGADQIEGCLYCPAMPSDLKTATIDFRRDDDDPLRIDGTTWLKRIDQRKRYMLRPKEKPDQRGTTPMICPASGPSATVRCTLKPADYARNRNKKGLINIPKARQPKGLHIDRVCTQSSIHVPLKISAAKYIQDVRFATERWFRLYRSARNFIEGINAYVKDEGKTGLGIPGRRPARGYAKQYVLATFLLFASNIRLIEAHEARLKREEVNGHVAPHKPSGPRRRDITNNGRYNPTTGQGSKSRTWNESAPSNGDFVDKYVADED